MNPLSAADALDRVEEWLSLPHIHLIEPSESHFATWASLLKGLGTA